MVGYVATTLVGLAGLAVSWLAWTGRWRGAGRSAIAANWAWTVLPGTSLIFLTYGVQPLVGDAGAYIAGPAVLLALIFVLWEPDWYGPRWWRERDTTAVDLMAPDNAYLHAAMAPGLGHDASIHQAERMMGGVEPEARVPGALITARHGRPSVLQRPGAVEGQFLLYPRGIVFAANKLEDKMRQEAVLERLAGDRIRRV